MGRIEKALDGRNVIHGGFFTAKKEEPAEDSKETETEKPLEGIPLIGDEDEEES